MLRPLRIGPRGWVLVIGLLNVSFFVAAGVLLLPLLGLETDEAMFLRCLYEPRAGAAWFSVFHHAWPNMMMSYLGALKSWLYAPLLLAGMPSIWMIRMPMLLAAGVTIILLGWVLFQLHGTCAAIIGMTLFATDSGILLTGVNDWGPVVLHNLLLAAALLVISKWNGAKSPWPIFWGGVLLGLNLWNKALFIWNLSGLAIALLLIARHRSVLWLWLKRGAVGLVIGFLVGAYPLLRFNLKNRNKTLDETAHFSFAQIPGNWRALQLTLNGQFGPVMLVDQTLPAPDSISRPFQQKSRHLAAYTPHISTYLLPIGMAVCGLAIVLGDRKSRRLILFFLVADAVGWFEAAITKGAGNSLHHTALFLVLWYCALAVAFSELLRGNWKVGRTVVVLVVSFVTLRALASDNLLYANMLDYEARSAWSNAEAALTSDLLHRAVRRVIVADWGLSDEITARTGNRILVSFANPEIPSDRPIFTGCQEPDCVIATHTPGAVIDRKWATVFESFLAREHLRHRNERSYWSTHGTPEILTFTLQDEN